ncbi:MAG TPA: HAMP domain-containing sensor histidine kinase [Actinomycetota bacterium]
MSPGRPRRFRDLPLFWRLLVPYAVLLVTVGAAGGFLIVRDLASRAQTTLDRDLARRSFEARAVLHNRELYLLESANFAANLQGMADAMRARDVRAIRQLLASVRVLKGDLTLVAALDPVGVGSIEFRQDEDGETTRRSGRNWGRNGFIREALADPEGRRRAGVVTIGEPILSIVAPVCRTRDPCDVVGAALVGISIERLAAEAAGQRSGGPEAVAPAAGIALYDLAGELLAAAGLSGVRSPPPDVPDDQPVRVTGDVEGSEVATLYSPLELQDRRVGTLGVAMPTATSFSSARDTGIRLAGLLLAVLVAMVAVGALLSRSILGQVRPLVKTNRALGQGDLGARAEVLGDDELGELARGVNQMAEQLQASHGTLEQRVAERTREVQRLLEERSDLFAALSHELRTPLSLILGNGELLLDPDAPRAKAWRNETTQAIVGSAEHLLDLVNDILDLAKAERGRLELTQEDILPAELLAELRPTVEGLARPGELEVTFDVPDDLPIVRGDRRRLKEVVLNLVDNAVKYTPAGGSVHVTGFAKNGHVQFAISDTGPGLPLDVGDRVFEPFYRVEGTKPQRGRASSGLGLAISKRFVEAHGGAIWYESEPGAGSTFRFKVPHGNRDGHIKEDVR